jgi:hypothetical protein
MIITLKNSSHLERRVGLSDTILKGTHPGTIYARFGPYIDASCQAVSEEKMFLTSANQKKKNLGGHVCWPNGTK